MTLESLLLSQDPELVRVIRPALESLEIDVEVCHEARAGADILISDKFDAVIVDCDDLIGGLAVLQGLRNTPSNKNSVAFAILISDKFDAVIVDCDDLSGGLAVLQGLRNTPSNKNSVAFAILNGKRTTTQDAFGMGANFVLQKPISAVNASRCFHAALNFMLRERRRYFRQPVKIQVKVVLEGKTLNATSTNISEGGMAAMLREAVPKGAIPHLKFTLPNSDILFEVEAEVAWADTKGLAGFRFQNVPKSTKEQLERWLQDRIEEEFPGTKQRIAAAESNSLSN